MKDVDDLPAERNSSCASILWRYVVVPAAIIAVLANADDILKYLKLVGMSAGKTSRERA